MEYIAPNEDGLNSLEGYLHRQPPDLAQSLRWAIQICHGMEYAYSKGLRVHRDLKPANIMITQDMTVKITDFGLAGVISESPAMHATGLGALPGQTMLGAGFGTPTYMAPEQFKNASGCDERSDLYSFGIMLYQMGSGGQLPFPISKDADWKLMYRLHRESPVPHLDSPLFPILQHCLEKLPEKRYQTFKEIRKDLELLLKHQNGELIIPPQSKELEAWEWNNKGFSLDSMERYEEAIHCYDQSIELDPLDAVPWNNKGSILNLLGHYEDAISCLDKALEFDPRNVKAWNNKGFSLHNLGRYEEAILCFDKALEFNPRNVKSWTDKGGSLKLLGLYEDAICCLDKALELDPNLLFTWLIKANCLNELTRYKESIHCYEQALELDPHYSSVLYEKALAEDKLGQRLDAARSYQQFLTLAPFYDAERIEYSRKRLQELGGK